MLKWDARKKKAGCRDRGNERRGTEKREKLGACE